MFYKPKFCCECGEKIERVGGEVLPSGRFCDDCARHYERPIRVKTGIAAGLVFIVGVFGAAMFQPAPKPVAVTTAQTLVSTAPTQTPTNAKSQAPPQTTPTAQTAQTPQQSKPAPQTPPLVANAPNEPVYYCGARTQKGTPCTRRVKGGGRCWQHEGKTAMLPDEKLLIR